MKVSALSTFLLSAAFLGACPNRTPPPPPIAPLSPDQPPAPEPVVGDDPMLPASAGESGGDAEGAALLPGACEAMEGVCGAASCAERGATEVEGTCYLQGEPQTDLSCCDG